MAQQYKSLGKWHHVRMQLRQDPEFKREMIDELRRKGYDIPYTTGVDKIISLNINHNTKTK